MSNQNQAEAVLHKAISEQARVQVIVIGGGQAGLAVGHYLSEAGVDLLILESGARIGDAWRNRWDSLRLFSSAQHSGLPGLPFPGDPRAFPTKDEVADYLERYARRARLPVRLNTKVKSLGREGERYVITTWDARFEADHIVIATGPYQKARVPSWAAELDPAIFQIHSGAYKNPSQLPAGDVLVVGAGNTGAVLALEAASTGRRVWLSGRIVGQVPSFLQVANGGLFWFLATRVFTSTSSIGQKIHTALRAGHGGPLVRIRSKEVTGAGIQRVGRASGTRDGQALLEGGRVLNVASILWCTGFGVDFNWVHLPVFAPDGYPLHERGRAISEPGLYFVGLPFQQSFSSSLIGGVGRDAALVAAWIVESIKRSANVRHPFMAPNRAIPGTASGGFGLK